MNFDQIPARMNKLGVDRAWLAKQTDYTEGHLGNILAPNGDPKSKTKKALRGIWRALDQEEERQQKPALELHQVVLRLNDEQFDEWNKKALEDKQTIREWCFDTLNEAAKLVSLGQHPEFPSARVAAHAAEYGSKKKADTK